MRRLLCAFATVTALTVTTATASAQPTPVAGRNEAPSADDIERALAAVKADPNMATERTIKMLRWNPTPPSQSRGLPSWLIAILKWFAGLITWFNESTRMLWWLAAAALAGGLVVYLIRAIGEWGPSSLTADRFVAPTHVQDLDIRPETLPPDVGAAARALWDRGERRAAMALLYRGLLSRLAHVHRVPIRDSSTEGDCLALSASRLPEARYDYASRLVRLWQRTVYADEQLPAAAVHAVCVEFGPALDQASTPERSAVERST